MKTTVQRIQMLKCPKCGETTLHPKRKELGYHVCVNCSTVKGVVGVTTVEGTGDHTYNDIIIMSQDKYRAIATAEAHQTGNKAAQLELLNLDVDENEVSQSIKESVNNVFNDEVVDDETDNDTLRIKGIDY